MLSHPTPQRGQFTRSPEMRVVRRWTHGLLLGIAVALLTGCASKVTCGILVVSNGKAVPASREQFVDLEKKLAPHVAARDIKLVRDARSAEFLALIEIVPQSGMPNSSEIQLRDIRRNPSYVDPNRQPSVGSKPYSPSADEVNREQQRILSSASYTPSGSP